MRAMDLYGGLQQIALLTTVEVSANQTTTTFLATRDFDGEGFAVLEAVTTSGTTPTMTAKLQESTAATVDARTDVTNGAFAEVNGSSTTAKHQVIPIDFNSLNGFVGLDIVIGGTSTPKAVVSCVIYGRKRVS